MSVRGCTSNQHNRHHKSMSRIQGCCYFETRTLSLRHCATYLTVERVKEQHSRGFCNRNRASRSCSLLLGTCGRVCIIRCVNFTLHHPPSFVCLYHLSTFLILHSSAVSHSPAFVANIDMSSQLLFSFVRKLC